MIECSQFENILLIVSFNKNEKRYYCDFSYDYEELLKNLRVTY